MAAVGFKIGLVKQVNSGDNIVLWRKPQGGPPPEKLLALSGITAPKLARQKTPNQEGETKDEPYAFEAREYLRKKLVGREVYFTADKPPNSITREYGTVWTGSDPTKDENITEGLVSEGYAKLRDTVRTIPQFKRLLDLEEIAKTQGKGIWSTDLQEHVRDIKWTVENPKAFVNKHNGKPIKAIVEYVRDGSTVRLLLLPDYYMITVMLSGIRCPSVRWEGNSEEYALQARYFVESHLLQRDVEVILESVNNANFVGTVLHPNGNIAELLLKEGFARCVDWSLAVMKSGASALRQAEARAKEQRIHIWKDYTSNAQLIPANDKEFQGTVVEVLNGDALQIKLNNGFVKKIFLSSIRPPREKNSGPEEEGAAAPAPRSKNFRPLYDIPWMFEAREFLRKKLIGKRVNVTVDYIQPPKDKLPEKICSTVLIGGANVAEALVLKGLASVVRYRRDDDQRSCHYDKLLEAETKATKSGVGIFAKKDIPAHRIQETSGDAAKAKKFLHFLKRAAKTEATVEFVASGARLRLFVPKEHVLITFLLAGITCPRGARPAIGTGGPQPAEPFGEEALLYTKEKCLQRDVTITVEDMDKAGNFYGWLWIENENLSVSLVEQGLASLHFSAEASEYARTLKIAEDNAKKQKLRLWKDYVEVEKVRKLSLEPVLDRKVKYTNVYVTEITSEGHFYAQNQERAPKLEALTEALRQEFKSSPPLPGAYSPKRGDICAAQFQLDGDWYRAKVEKVQGENVSVLYIDYGNREVLNSTRCAQLPAGLSAEPPFATEYALVCVKFPADEEDKSIALGVLSKDVLNTTLLLNVEVRGAPSAVTLVEPSSKNDIGKSLVSDGLVLVENLRDRRLAPLLAEYRAAQDQAKKSRFNLWQHGDITEDDDREFGARNQR